MQAARRRDERRLQEVVASLEVFKLEAPGCLQELVGPLGELLEAGQVYTYASKRIDAPGHQLEFVHTHGSPLSPVEVQRGMEALVGGGRSRWGFFDPERPEPDQQNRALVVPIPGSVESARQARVKKDWKQVAEQVASTASANFRQLRIHDQSQLRVLVCEDGKLLAWVGVFRDARMPFGRREQQLLQRLAPALRRRLSHERLLGMSGPRALAFDAALEAISAAAFLLDQQGSVLHANAAGLEALSREPSLRRSLQELRRADATHAGFTVTRFSGRGLPTCLLAIRRRAEADPKAMLPFFAREWSLTGRQAEVLTLIAAGESNRSIAVTLTCSERTVEHHVTQLLDKAQVDSRAALVARFWRTAIQRS